MRDDWSPPAPLPVAALFSHPLPQAEASKIGQYNQLLACSDLNSIRVREKDVSFLLAGADLNSQSLRYEIRAVSGDKTLRIGCDIDGFAALFPDAFDTTNCDLPLLRVLLHLLVSKMDGPIARLAGNLERLDIFHVSPDSSDPLAISVEMHVQDAHPALLSVSGNLEILAPISKSASTVRQHRLLQGVSLQCRAVSPSFEPVPGGAKSLEIGDLIFLNAISLNRLFSLTSGDASFAQLAFGSNGLTITDLNLSSDRPLQTGDSPTMPADDNSALWENVSTKMSLEIGDWPMSIKEIDALRAGTVLDIGQLDTNNVQIRVNGQIVGSGALLSIGDGIGLRVETLS